MLEQHVLDLAGRQVLAAAHDHVVEPALDEQEAVVVEVAGVVGGEPAVVVERAAAEVLAGDLLAAHVDLAALAGGDRLAVGVADLELERRAAAGRPSRAGARTAGSSLAKASRWSSGPSTAMVELVSVSP